MQNKYTVNLIIHWHPHYHLQLNQYYQQDFILPAGVCAFVAVLNQLFHFLPLANLIGLIHDWSAGCKNGVIRFGIHLMSILALANVVLERCVVWHGALSNIKSMD